MIEIQKFHKKSWKSSFKIGDFFLIGFFLSLVLISYSLSKDLKGFGQTALVEVAGKLMYKISLKENQSITLNGKYGKNILVVENGFVFMQSAECPEQICRKIGKISRVGETIVCLPNKIVVLIEGGGKRVLDGVVQ